MSRTLANENATGSESFFIDAWNGRSLYERSPFSPMVFVDFGLILLLLFITVHFSELVLRPGIEMRLPSSEFIGGSSFSKFDTALITLSREGMIFFNDELTTMDGLRTAIVRAGHSNPDKRLLIQADSSIDYGTLIKIYNMGIEAGVRDVTLATGIVPDTFE